MEKIKAEDLDKAFDKNEDISPFLDLSTTRHVYASTEKSFDGLIFDLDGTLWDCSKASAQAFNRAYQESELSLNVTSDFVKSISGKPSSECDAILLKEVPPDLKNATLEHFDKFEKVEVKAHAASSLLAGVAEGLIALAKHYPLYLVSNCGEQYLKVFLEETPVGHLFKDSECHGRTGLNKAHNIRMLVERQKLSLPCYIGDTAGDEQAAKEAGVEFFFVSYGFGRQVGTSPRFGSFSELTDYFLPNS